MQILADLQKHTGNARILTDGLKFLVGNLVILNDSLQNFLGLGPLFFTMCLLNASLHIAGQIAVCFHAQALYCLGNHRCT